MKLSTRTLGATDKPLVVLLHAIGTDGSMWAPQMAALSSFYHVMAIDLPGHGKSAVPAADAGISGFASDVIETIDALGVDRFALVGLSLGSMVAQRVAATLGDRITALVLSNGISYAPELVRDVWAARIREAEGGGMAATVDATLARWFTPDYREADPATIDAIATTIANTPLQGFLAAAHAIAALDNRECLPRIKARTLVLAGERDIASPPPAVRSVADAVPGACFEILPGGHLMNLELAESYSARLLNFLRQS